MSTCDLRSAAHGVVKQCRAFASSSSAGTGSQNDFRHAVWPFPRSRLSELDEILGIMQQDVLLQSAILWASSGDTVNASLEVTRRFQFSVHCNTEVLPTKEHTDLSL